MIEKGKGGANTLTGLNFEKKVNFSDLLRGIRGYTIQKSPAKAGFVDEKLQTCDFKRKQYLKLVQSLELKVEYVYAWLGWVYRQRLNNDSPTAP
ncbi:MAG: hypothetical protein LBI85_01870 [Spirochaetaceae bacterium]|nr:hypothetical protein [Spirochaetaceae bacterium]